MHGIPMTTFSEDGLNVIATKLGTPLMLDSYTSDMCMQSWGRSSYTKAMIELPVDVELKDSIVVAMPKLVGEGFYMCTIRVEHVSNKNGASSSGKKKQDEVSRQEVRNSNPFDVLNSIENDDNLGTNGEISKSLMLVDDDGNPLVPTGNVDSESEVEVVFDETANLMASTSFKSGNDGGYGTNSLLE
ncbi:hypothetical protein Tco_0104653 [Tanacetum coccineum]